MAEASQGIVQNLRSPDSGKGTIEGQTRAEIARTREADPVRAAFVTAIRDRLTGDPQRAGMTREMRFFNKVYQSAKTQGGEAPNADQQRVVLEAIYSRKKGGREQLRNMKPEEVRAKYQDLAGTIADELILGNYTELAKQEDALRQRLEVLAKGKEGGRTDLRDGIQSAVGLRKAMDQVRREKEGVQRRLKLSDDEIRGINEHAANKYAGETKPASEKTLTNQPATEGDVGSQAIKTDEQYFAEAKQGLADARQGLLDVINSGDTGEIIRRLQEVRRSEIDVRSEERVQRINIKTKEKKDALENAQREAAKKQSIRSSLGLLKAHVGIWKNDNFGGAGEAPGAVKDALVLIGDKLPLQLITQLGENTYKLVGRWKDNRKRQLDRVGSVLQGKKKTFSEGAIAIITPGDLHAASASLSYEARMKVLANQKPKEVASNPVPATTEVPTGPAAEVAVKEDAVDVDRIDLGFVTKETYAGMNSEQKGDIDQLIKAYNRWKTFKLDKAPEEPEAREQLIEAYKKVKGSTGVAASAAVDVTVAPPIPETVASAAEAIVPAPVEPVVEAIPIPTPRPDVGLPEGHFQNEPRIEVEQKIVQTLQEVYKRSSQLLTAKLKIASDELAKTKLATDNEAIRTIMTQLADKSARLTASPDASSEDLFTYVNSRYPAARVRFLVSDSMLSELGLIIARTQDKSSAEGDEARRLSDFLTKNTSEDNLSDVEQQIYGRGAKVLDVNKLAAAMTELGKPKNT